MSEGIDAQIAEHTRVCNALVAEVGKVVVGQEPMITRLLIGLLTGGHVLLEGVPGLAKTLTVRSLATAIDTGFSRIQFTPDMLPADVIGTEIFNPREGTYSVKRGPLFSNLILADEINRAPAKVQAALLEAMQERQVTIGGTTYPFDEPFLVLATQNPIEQEGTYPLPEAQIDRFMLKVVVGYPSKDDERKIVDRMASGQPEPVVQQGRDPGPDPGGAQDRREDLHRRQGQGLRRRPRPRDPRPEGRRHPRPRGHDRDGRLAAGVALPDPGRQGERVSAGPQLCDAPRRQDPRSRRPAPPRRDHLRGRGRGQDAART